ncbi:hypothetical protein PG995_008296 [Apiospora arundinis]
MPPSHLSAGPMDTRHLVGGGSPAEGGDKPETGILDLPMEILSLICESFRVGRYRPKESLETSKALRLTNRRLNTAATPMLFSTLTIKLDKESMCRANELVSCNPIMAASVRTVVISLACRNSSLVDEKVLFTEAWLENIDNICGYYDPHWQESREGRDWLGWRPSLERESPILRQCHEHSKRSSPEAIECFRIGHRLFDAWNGRRWSNLDNDVGGAHRGSEHECGVRELAKTDREEGIHAYRQLLLGAHKDYSKKHQEQLEIIESGSFAQDIAQYLTKLPHKGLQIIITDDPIHPILSSELGSRYNDCFRLINDNEKLLSAMTAPHYWLDISTFRPGLGLNPRQRLLPAARLISEIPVACFRAGTPITDLKIECFPPTVTIVGGFSAMFPLSSSLPSLEAWDAELCTASQHLKRFHFGRHYQPHQKTLLSAHDQDRLTLFLSAMLSGDKLDSIHVDTYPVYGDSDIHPKYRYDAMASALKTVDLEKLRTLHLRGFSIDQKALETVCRRLIDGGALEEVHLSCVRLMENGGERWADVKDILQESISCSGNGVESAIDLCLDKLVGGEFFPEEEKEDIMGDMGSLFLD